MAVGDLAFFVGCGDEVKSVDYYKKYLEKAKIKNVTKMRKINEDQKQDCKNASEDRFK